MSEEIRQAINDLRVKVAVLEQRMSGNDAFKAIVFRVFWMCATGAIGVIAAIVLKQAGLM